MVIQQLNETFAHDWQTNEVKSTPMSNKQIRAAKKAMIKLVHHLMA